MTSNKLTRVLTLGTLALLAGTAVEAETLNCTPITSLPTVITSQGIYCLTGHLATAQTNGAAIEITAPNVTLDLNGWKVGGQGAGKGTTAYGIYGYQANVTIKNGTVRGFSYGVYLRGPGAVVEDVLADGNTQMGIFVTGDGAVVRRNQVVNTGGSTSSPTGGAFGIYSQSTGALIEHNTVSGLYPVGSGGSYGIGCNPSLDSVVRGNVVSGSATPAAGFGIFSGSTSHVSVVENVVSNFNVCVFYMEAASGIYSRNVANGCTTKYTGGTAGTGND